MEYSFSPATLLDRIPVSRSSGKSTGFLQPAKTSSVDTDLLGKYTPRLSITRLQRFTGDHALSVAASARAGVSGGGSIGFADSVICVDDIPFSIAYASSATVW